MEFAQWTMLPQPIHLARETVRHSPLGSLLEEADSEVLLEEGKIRVRTLDFTKWGSHWSVRAYMFEPVEPDDLVVLGQIMASFHFEAIPAGYEPWAVVEAVAHLPTVARPQEYPIAGRLGTHWTRTHRICDAVLVTFGKIDTRESDTDSIWQFLVTGTGEVIQILKPRSE